MVSGLLNDRIPQYQRFAQNSRRWVAQQEQARPTNQISALNGACKISYEALHRRFDELRTRNQLLEDRLVRMESGFVRMEEKMYRLANLLEQRQPQFLFDNNEDEYEAPRAAQQPATAPPATEQAGAALVQPVPELPVAYEAAAVSVPRCPLAQAL